MPKIKKEKAPVTVATPSFSIERKNLIEGLSTVKVAIATSSTLPVLSFVHAKWGADKITFTATDLTTCITRSVPVENATPGETLFPGVLVLKLAEKFAGDTVQISVDDKQIMHLACGEAKYKFTCIAPDEFPPVPVIDTKGKIEIEAPVLRHALENTSFASGQDSSRAILEGSFVNLTKQVVVSTDGRRLALCGDLPEAKTPDIVVPSLSVTRLIPMLGEDGTVKIEVGENKVKLSFADTVVVSNLIEGTFPNYKQVIPTKCKYKVVVDVQAMLDVLNRIALVSTVLSPSVKLAFDKDTLEFSTNNADVGTGAESIPIKYQGDKLEISFAPQYLQDALKCIAEGEATLEFNDGLSPISIKSGSLLYVIMPLRMN
jgi:DNA polymerase-3 subunit beta